MNVTLNLRISCAMELVKIDLKDIGINTREWVDSTQDKDY